MKKYILLGTLCTLSACTSFQESAPSMYLNPTVFSNVEAKVNVGERITGVSRCEHLFFQLITPTDQTYLPTNDTNFGALSKDACVAGAVYDALSTSGADVIVSPQYHSKRDGLLCLFGNRCLLGTTTTWITGWSGKISYK
ncbi:hypothetical protein HDR63_04115 [bacterium]|nr:hypothetical protein [bacterium]